MAIPKVSRARAENMKIGTVVEKHEHRWATKPEVKRIVSDHLRENPEYYTKGSCSDQTVTVKIKQIRPKKKVPPPPPPNAPEWIGAQYRLYG